MVNHMATEKVKQTELGSKEFWQRLREDPKALAVEVCTVSLVDLDKTLYEHSGLRAWVNTAYENARTAKAQAEWKVTKTRASVLLNAKATLDAQTNKPKTVDAVKAEVDNDPTVDAAENELLQADEKCGSLKAMANALEDRLQMLIQISANRRKERDEHQ